MASPRSITEKDKRLGLNNLLRLNTLTKKSVALNILVGCLLIGMIHLFFPAMMYESLKPYLSRYISSLVNANTVRQSYIWRGNEMAYALGRNTAIAPLIAAYDTAANQAAVAEEIRAELSVRRIGLREGTKDSIGEGAISAISYSMLYTEKGGLFYRDEAADIARVILASDWLKTIAQSEAKAYSPVLRGEEGVAEVICFSRAFMANGVQCYGIHAMDFSYIKDQFKDILALGIDDYQLIWDDQVLYSNLGEASRIQINQYPAELFEGLQYQPQTVETADGIHFLTLASFKSERFRLAVYADKKTMMTPYQDIFGIMLTMIYVIVGVLMILSGFILKRVLRRLTKLIEKMRSVKQENYNVVLNDNSSDEVGELARTFNDMIKTIRLDIEHKLAFEKKEQQMKYSLLVSAMDPHFVYNTLNTITFLAQMNKAEDIVLVNKALIGTLKDHLTMKDCKIFDSVQNEKDFLEKYMVIQRYLLHHTIHYSFEAAAEDLYLQIPKNILQPIIENSIKHGILPHKNARTKKVKNGIITVRVFKESGWIYLSVADNGIGMPAEDIGRYFAGPFREQREPCGEHIGIRNIRMRLSYIYHDNYTITATGGAGAGTKILIKIPDESAPSMAVS